MEHRYLYYWNRLRDNYIWADCVKELYNRNWEVLGKANLDPDLSFEEYDKLVEDANVYLKLYCEVVLNG